MDKCQEQALFRYTWPGRDESFICLEHAQQLQGLARAIGLYLQFIPLSGDEQMRVSCSQEVRANKVLQADGDYCPGYHYHPFKNDVDENGFCLVCHRPRRRLRKPLKRPL